MTENEIKSKYRSLFKEWKKDYLTECDIWRGVAIVAFNGKRFEAADQIEFIRLYLGFLYLERLSPGNMKKLKRFLSLQASVTGQGKLAIHFIGKEAPRVYLLVESLEDIDLADVYAITGFKKIQVFNKNARLWSKKSVLDIVKAVHKDLSFDFQQVDLKGTYSKDCLTISCRVDSGLEMLRLGAAIRMNVLK